MVPEKNFDFWIGKEAISIGTTFDISTRRLWIGIAIFNIAIVFRKIQRP